VVLSATASTEAADADTGNAQGERDGSLICLKAGTRGTVIFWTNFRRMDHMSRKVLALLLIGLAIVAGAGVVGWTLLLRPIKVEVARPERDVTVQVFGLGTVEPRIQSKIGFKVSGVLIDLTADVGDRVAKGAVLARLDSREQAARLARANALAEQTAANLLKAKASVEKAEANYATAKNVRTRRETLAQSNITSVETAENAVNLERAAAAELSLAKSDVAVAQATIEDAKAQKQQETATFDFHALMAPYDAMVIARLKELGSALATGEPVFTIIDPKTVWVLAYIDETKAGEIAVGQPVEIVLRSQPSRRIVGRVARLEPESDRVNEERKIQIAFDRIPDDFNLGEQAEVFITTVRLERPVLVPEAAVSDISQGRGTVWVVNNGRLEQQEVEIGHRLLDGRVELAKGIPDGAAVAAKLQSGFWTGRSATIAEGRRP
jgi:HlyD family secretion protein